MPVFFSLYLSSLRWHLVLLRLTSHIIFDIIFAKGLVASSVAQRFDNVYFDLLTHCFSTQHTTLTTDKHPCPGGIRTHNFSRRTAEDLRLRPRGHWDQCPFWEAKSTPAGPEAPCILWNHMARYGVKKSQLSLTWDTWIHSKPYIHIYLRLPSHLRLGFPSCLFPLRFPNKTVMHSYARLSNVTRATRTPPPPLLVGYK